MTAKMKEKKEEKRLQFSSSLCVYVRNEAESKWNILINKLNFLNFEWKTGGGRIIANKYSTEVSIVLLSRWEKFRREKKISFKKTVVREWGEKMKQL